MAKEMKQFFIIILAILLQLSCYQVNDEGLGVKEINGIPVLFEYGIPYFTRFQRTDHFQLNLSGAWKFKIDPEDKGVSERWFEPGIDDKDWFEHPVPGSWNVQKKEWLDYVGAGWYRRRFIVPKEFSERFNRLTLDGVSFKADVYLNGKFLGSHSGGFSRFNFDVSEQLNYGAENFLAIRVDNRRDWDSLPPKIYEKGPLGWWAYGGIHHQVLVESGPMITVCKLAVNAEHTGRINLQAAVYNHKAENSQPMVFIGLEDLAGNPVADLLYQETLIPGKELWAFKIERSVENIKPWSPEEPNFYRLRVRITAGDGAEDQTIDIGFRTFEIKSNKIYFNGKPFYIRGINRHEDDPETGRYQSDARIQKDIELIHQLDANLIRTSHYPNDPRFLDACDKEGILVMEEISLHQVGWCLKGVNTARKSALFYNAGRELIQTIERDRNHPSLVMYSLGDESFTFIPTIRILHRRLYELAKRFDREKPVTLAIVTVPYRITPWLEMTAGIGDIISVNEYYGWYYGDISQLSAFLDSLYKKWPHKPIIISEMGAEGIIGKDDGKLYPIGYGKARDFSEDYQLKFYKEQLSAIKSKPYISGVIPWVFADHRDDKRPKSSIPLMNTKGVLTYDRKKKKVFNLLSEFFLEMENKYQSSPDKAGQNP